MIKALAVAIASRVQSESHLALARALDVFDARLVAAERAGLNCSYAAAIGTYVGLKIDMHHVQKAMHRYAFEGDMQKLFSRLNGMRARVQTLRWNMYKNPCKKCEFCERRRAAWPEHVELPMSPVIEEYDPEMNEFYELPAGERAA